MTLGSQSRLMKGCFFLSLALAMRLLLRLSRSVFQIALFLVADAFAQDVTIGEIHVSPPGPQIAPALKSPVPPAYPEEMSPTDEIGYVWVSSLVDDNGKPQNVTVSGNHLAFQRAVEASVARWEITPGQSAGKRVAAKIQFPVVFNPRSAVVGDADATPRLILPSRVIGSHPPVKLRVRFSLDREG